MTDKLSRDLRKHETVRLSKLNQERKCANMHESELRAEMQQLKDLLAKVKDEYNDRAETILCICGMIDVVRALLIEKIDNHGAQI